MMGGEYCAFDLNTERDAWVCSRCGFSLQNATALGLKRPYAFCKSGGGQRESPAEAARRVGNRAGGAGDELKKALDRLGLKATPGCACLARAAMMNAKGPDWCDEHINEIVGWLREEAEKRRLPFLDAAGRMLVRRAIANARRKEQARAQEAQAEGGAAAG